MKDYEPKVAYDNRMWRPQPMNAYVASDAMDETAWTALAYGFAARGYFDVYEKDNKTKIALDTLYDDAVELGLGVMTIDLPHLARCNRLICNCKIM